MSGISGTRVITRFVWNDSRPFSGRESVLSCQGRYALHLIIQVSVERQRRRGGILSSNEMKLGL